jgi:hypothetical protein
MQQTFGSSPLKHGLVDFGAVLFVIGGVVALAMTLLTLPVSSVYPLSLPTNLSTAFLVVFGVSIICALGAVHCASLAMRRMLSEAGIRGMIFGALLLIFTLGLPDAFRGSNIALSGLLTTISAIMIVIGGVVCFSLRHTTVSASAIAREHAISQPLSR